VASHDYVFQTRWEVQGTVEEVWAILGAPLDLPRWWPSVYLSARQEGDFIHLHTRGILPYTLRWSFRPSGYALEAWGDLEGRGQWLLAQVGPDVQIVYDWTVRANKPILRYLSFLLRPLFAANHAWAMALGQESLRRELRRRRGQPVAPPPGRIWGLRSLFERR